MQVNTRVHPMELNQSTPYGTKLKWGNFFKFKLIINKNLFKKITFMNIYRIEGLK